VNGSSAVRLNVGKCFFFDGGDNHLIPLRARSVQHEERELAIAGDEAETCHEQESASILILKGAPSKLRLGGGVCR